ncbi:MAG: carboxymuconolactone decarboxylase family protein [Candidatus Cyclobacteriaceae bacterium M3_2C_046]
MEEQKQNPIEVFQQEAPEVAEAYDGLIEALKNKQGLDPKTKQLLYIGMKVVLGDNLAVQFHIPMAKHLGASREEIKDTILMTLTVTGLKSVVDFLPDALSVYDQA